MIPCSPGQTPGPTTLPAGPSVGTTDAPRGPRPATAGNLGGGQRIFCRQRPRRCLLVPRGTALSPEGSGNPRAPPPPPQHREALGRGSPWQLRRAQAKPPLSTGDFAASPQTSMQRNSSLVALELEPPPPRGPCAEPGAALPPLSRHRGDRAAAPGSVTTERKIPDEIRPPAPGSSHRKVLEGPQSPAPSRRPAGAYLGRQNSSGSSEEAGPGWGRSVQGDAPKGPSSSPSSPAGQTLLPEPPSHEVAADGAGARRERAMRVAEPGGEGCAGPPAQPRPPAQPGPCPADEDPAPPQEPPQRSPGAAEVARRLPGAAA